PELFALLHTLPNVETWQLHKSENEGAQNFADDRIANLDESTAHWLKLSANADGTFAVTNGRTDAGARPRSDTTVPGRLLVLNKDDATFVAVDPDSGAILGTVPVGQGPHELVVSTDGKYAFASNYGTGPAPGKTISMIDLAAMKEIRRIDVSPLSRPHGLDFAGGKLYFTAEASRKIARYDPASDKIDWEFETGQATTHMVLVTRDRKTIFTSNIGSGTLSRIQQGSNGAWAQSVIPVGKGPEGIDVSPDGKEIWSARSQDGGVSVIDAATGAVKQTIDVGTKRSNRIKLTPDGTFALISDDESGDLVVLDAPARTVTKRIALGSHPEGIVIAPDGSRAFVAVNADNTIAVIDLKTWQVTKKLHTGAGPDGMAWVGR
ncbi:MAG TPA: beta-propeller fold lactonase family protein, partial [Vicinamibacterales bacterium]|nr:beta-propeller fold lactonase family protein [Vicinamibacterales bacterium]